MTTLPDDIAILAQSNRYVVVLVELIAEIHSVLHRMIDASTAHYGLISWDRK